MSEVLHSSTSSSSSSIGSPVRLDSAGESSQDNMVVPSLGIDELEGRIHSYEGPLEYRRGGKLSSLTAWKKRWFRISADSRRANVFNLLKSKSTQKRNSDIQKRLLTVPRDNPQISVNSVSSDPTSRDFLAFNVCDTRNGEVLYSFRAESVIQQRNFMAALSGKGPGLFTQNADDALEITMLTDGLSVNELFTRQQSYDRRHRSTRSRSKVPSYMATMAQLSKEFYLPEGISRPKMIIDFPGEGLPVYESVSAMGPTSPKTRRPENDSFLPPHGEPTQSPVSLGYGGEVGLETYQQAIWLPENNFYYFIDHQKKTSFLEDPRPPPVDPPMVQLKQLTYNGPSKPQQAMPQLCRDETIVRATARRAANKPIGFILKAHGENGSPGHDGAHGTTGVSGEEGSPGVGFDHSFGPDGGSGSDGFPGAHGVTGSTGTTGKDGTSLVLTLSGDASKLKVTDGSSISTVAKLCGDKADHVMLIDCHGGDGGCGGTGGNGGLGGTGGDGGKGGPDGDGGHGGDGGLGGNGANGARGGDAGNGGDCVIQATDARLLMLVEVNCEAGQAGRGGEPGRAGEGGRRGFGGEAGDPVGVPPGSRDSVVGLRGKPGMTGSSGADGTQGESGTEGFNGGILWVIQSADGETQHSSGTRYDAEIITLDVTPGVNNGAYEPNQRICVNNIIVKNSGGLPLPAGCKLYMPSTETIRFENSEYLLPEIEPGCSFTVPCEFYGRIFDRAPANEPGPFSTEASFTPKIELLGRPFESSCVEKTLRVMYPIKLPFALSRSNVSRGEVTTLDIGIENTSNVLYGSSDDSCGSIHVRVHMDARLIPLGVIYQHNTGQLPYSVTYDPMDRDSLYIDITRIEPGETLMISLAVQMDNLAELCDTCVWQAVLYLKGKRIEYRSKDIRISPAYTPPNEPSQLGDILMITSDSISRDQFLYWQKIFEILGVSVDFWDANYRKSSSSESPPPYSPTASPPSDSPKTILPKFTNLYSGKVILYPHCELDLLPARDIMNHFHGKYHSEGLEDLNSSLLLFLKSTYTQNLEEHTNLHVGHTKLLRHLCSNENKVPLPTDAYSGVHLLAPGTLVPPDWSMKRSKVRTMKSIENDSPSQSVTLYNCSTKIRKTSRVKYAYGTMDVRRVPLLRSCNFQCIDCTGRNYTAMGYDDPLLSPNSREFPIGSNFGQTLLAVLASLPLHCKLNILKRPTDKSSAQYIKCHLPNGLKLKKRDLAAICIASDVADEILNCPETLTRMKVVCEDLATNKAVYTFNGAGIIGQLVELIRLEVRERQKTLSASAMATSKECLRLCESITIQESKSVSQLPLLRTLQDRNTVLRSHQYCVNDNCYDASLS